MFHGIQISAMAGMIKKLLRPTPLLALLLTLAVAGGTTLFGIFWKKSNNYIDRATAHYIHELIKMADIPFEEHLDKAKLNLKYIDEYISYFHSDRQCRYSDIGTALDYFCRVNDAEEMLFLDNGLSYRNNAGISGQLEATDDEADFLFRYDVPLTRHMAWRDGMTKYVIAISTKPYYIDGTEYCALGFAFDPRDLNTFMTVHSYSGAARLFVMDETGKTIFTNDAWAPAGNHLEEYLEQGIMTEAQVDTILHNFRSGRHDWIKIQKPDFENFFCYHSGGHGKYSIAMEVPTINARSILTTLQSMLLIASTGIAVLFTIILLALAVFILLNHRNRLMAINEKKVSLAKSTFLSNMSHDIRTPMNAIIGYTTLAIAAGNKPELVQDYLGKIRSSSTHLLSLINDVLEMSRIESGKVHIETAPSSISAMLNDIESIVRADVDMHGHELTIDSSSVTNDVIICDKLRIRQIILNLLSNAIKYTPDGGHIGLSISERESELPDCRHYRIRIKDNGMGMSEEFAKTVFEEFTRERNSTISGIQGTGLGMAIVKNLVDLMGGRIGMKTRQNAGTEFTLDFDFPTDSSSDTVSIQAVQSFDFSGKRILLVEDNELNREIATAILEESGFEVSVAEDGAKAVELVGNAKPGDIDIVLMDIQMPVMNGFDATRHIRSLKNGLHDIPIIAMTANAFEEDRKEAIEAGMDEHVGKPIDVDSLKAVIAKFLH